MLINYDTARTYGCILTRVRRPIGLRPYVRVSKNAPVRTMVRTARAYRPLHYECALDRTVIRGLPVFATRPDWPERKGGPVGWQRYADRRTLFATRKLRSPS